MQTLIIDRKGARLTLEQRRLRIELPDAPRPQFVPIAMIERLILQATTTLESNVLGALAEAGASVLVLSPRDHRRVAIVLPPSAGDAQARLALYRAANDPALCLAFARRLVRLKLGAQQRNLRRWSGSSSAREALRALATARKALRAAASLDAVRSIEGGAARAYFAAMAEAVPASVGFAGRRRRPPPDPVNALLSLGYTLLHFDAVRALHAVGLDPMIGLYHAQEYNRESLACDLIEPFRAEVDRFVVGLFRSRTVRSEDFGEQQGACRLNKAGRRRFYAAWEEQAAGWRQRLLRASRWLRRKLMHEKG